MSSLIRKLEDVDKSNDIVTPDSSDLDSTESDDPNSPASVENEKIKHSEELTIIVEDNNAEEEDVSEASQSGEEEEVETVIDVSNNLQ